jgi:hypothetical protein
VAKQAKISLIVLKRLYDVMLETSIIKKHVRGTAPKGAHFFTHLDSKNISLYGVYRSNIAKEVFREMDTQSRKPEELLPPELWPQTCLHQSQQDWRMINTPYSDNIR